MQGLIDKNQNILRGRVGVNAGVPALGQPRAQFTQQMSFANQFAQLKEESAAQRDAAIMPELAAEFPQTGSAEPRAKTKIATGIYPGLNTNESSNQEQILKSLRREEFSREQETIASMETEMQSAAHIQESLSNSETVKATVTQAHQPETHDAVREGNVDEREARHYEGNDRKKQLANWEELAPRITEDIKNRAVRIDIPGLGDIETLIVRMQKSQVSIQAVGNKSAMKSLQGREAELKAKLASKNIHMASLQAFDARTVSTKRKVA